MTSVLSKISRRYLAAWFPYLPADRVMRRKASGKPADAPGGPCPDELPLVIVEKVKGASRLAAISPQAKRAGLEAGLALADARARIPDLWVEEADPYADAELLERIAEDCDRFTPVIVTDAPDGVLLDIK